MKDRSLIYKLFYEKLPDSLEDVMPVYSGCKIVTCLCPHYFITLQQESYSLYEEFNYICSDGILAILLNKLMGRKKSIRLSFDSTSMASPVFNSVIENGEKLYVLGAKQGEIERAIDSFKIKYPEISIAGFHHGYIKGKETCIADSIVSSGAKVCIIGMGAPAQDEMAVLLKKRGFVGTVYTCGGFIHQVQETMNYYPKWVDKLELRWLYRVFNEKGLLKRILHSFPPFIISYSLFLHKIKNKSKS
jgi:N-acetylglucosaminyldiphosphoundecaprenol N-acetyl-beta-D-mannosaminyltransferase